MKIGVLITARLKSKRLPKKVLRDLGGKPILAHLLERMRYVHLADSLSVITSTVSQDDDINIFCEEHGVDCFRGHPEDVLLRMRDAARFYELDWIVSVTADNPWVCPKWVDRLLHQSISSGWDFGKVDGLPFGAFSYVVKRDALEKACEIKNTSDTEVWGGYFDERFGFSVGVLDVQENSPVRRPSYRLTVDTHEDFQLAEALAENLPPLASPRSLDEIVEFLDHNPSVVEINSGVQQAIPKEVQVKDYD